MKKATVESKTLKREIHGLLKAQGGKKQLLPFYRHIRNCLLTS